MSGHVWTDIRIDFSLLRIGVLTAGARMSVTGSGMRRERGKGGKTGCALGISARIPLPWWATGARSPGTEILYVWMYL